MIYKIYNFRILIPDWLEKYTLTDYFSSHRTERNDLSVSRALKLYIFYLKGSLIYIVHPTGLFNCYTAQIKYEPIRQLLLYTKTNLFLPLSIFRYFMTLYKCRMSTML